MSKIEVNQISSQCGSTLTIGQSGDSIQLACGATQSGFGRTGTVDWDTTAKTASFTAVSGNGYFVNTTSGAITVTLPASPSAGDIVSVSDYAQTSGTNNITLARNGSNIEGAASNLVIQNNGVAMTFVYVDGTKGWKVVSAGAESDKEPVPEYIVATGGTITCCGDYKIHTFTGPGTFTVCSVGNPIGSTTVDYMVVAGGGGGGVNCAGAGAGAGGFRESSGAASGCYTASPLGACVSALPVSVQGYPITVGGGGAGETGSPGPRPGVAGCSGSVSTFSSITSAGGGGGGSGCTCNPNAPGAIGQPGGSGGGHSHGTTATVASGNVPPVSPPQGQNGGAQATPIRGFDHGGGGGGAGSSAPAPGVGGDGVTTSINATPTARAGGGGGGARSPGAANPAGGTGGGGPGGAMSPSGAAEAGTNGTANTGGGGGGMSGSSSACKNAPGGAGGSGIVIIRYKYQ